MIIENCRPIVHVSRLICIGRESTGEKIAVVVGNNRGHECIALIFPNDLLGGFRRFQRGLFNTSRIVFDNSSFSSGAGRARRWQQLVYRLLEEAGR